MFTLCMQTMTIACKCCNVGIFTTPLMQRKRKTSTEFLIFHSQCFRHFDGDTTVYPSAAASCKLHSHTHMGPKILSSHNWKAAFSHCMLAVWKAVKAVRHKKQLYEMKMRRWRSLGTSVGINNNILDYLPPATLWQSIPVGQSYISSPWTALGLLSCGRISWYAGVTPTVPGLF